jgi:hypothetical protein
MPPPPGTPFKAIGQIQFLGLSVVLGVQWPGAFDSLVSMLQVRDSESYIILEYMFSCNAVLAVTHVHCNMNIFVSS